ncbi:MAG: NosR/NirI family protein [Sulfuricaulis sp.]|uniref:NosR/NirI family protein n=1 Tax=Sulfuricaulis sp. TaxID=2003553 RepID=UPI0025E68AE8|nr:NosR/NirI family protein [Sulfuricaulis sp.]MCR4346681.1 NosR/NirI family protein [Sulfuricaulis sp.]
MKYLTVVLHLLILSLLISVVVTARAETIDELYPAVNTFFPQADRFDELKGKPPAAAVYQGERLLGYAYLTGDVIRIPAYSGHPINTLVGFDLAGQIVGIRIVEHQEPILVVGITEERLQQFARQYQGKSVFDDVVIGSGVAGQVAIDSISGATITVMVENATLTRSVRRVAESRGLAPPALPTVTKTEVASVEQQAPVSPSAGKAGDTKASRASTTVKSKSSTGVAAVEEPIWKGVWRKRTFQIAVLVAGLAFLTLVLVFQDWLAKRPRLLVYVRDGFLLYTVFFIGWYSLAQLSIINVITFVHSFMHGFQWEGFLIDPMMFILWSFVAVTLLLWGRGIYCGWLCPFGALQELTQQLARRFGVKQREFPEMMHERLWALKYIILLGLFGISLQSLTQAERLAEIEPFKTAITMRFQREWGYVLFAAGLILVSAINRKFYCKYLCPLGAALTIPGKFRIFDWLRRHRECGRPCQVCAAECEVQAIRKNGEINANECHYCLDCQVTYWNDHKCPPEVDRRKRRGRSVRARELALGMESAFGSTGLDDVGVRGEPGQEGCSGCPQSTK